MSKEMKPFAIFWVILFAFVAFCGVMAFNVYDTDFQKHSIQGYETNAVVRSLINRATPSYQVDAVPIGAITNTYTRWVSGANAQFIMRSQFSNTLTTVDYALTNWSVRTNAAVTWLPINE